MYFGTLFLSPIIISAQVPWLSKIVFYTREFLRPGSCRWDPYSRASYSGSRGNLDLYQFRISYTKSITTSVHTLDYLYNIPQNLLQVPRQIVLKPINPIIHFSFHRKAKTDHLHRPPPKRRKKLCDTPTKIVHDTIQTVFDEKGILNNRQHNKNRRNT
jgi:hypothetical protein